MKSLFSIERTKASLVYLRKEKWLRKLRKDRSLKKQPLYVSVTLYTQSKLYAYGLVPIQNVKENDNSIIIYASIHVSS